MHEILTDQKSFSSVRFVSTLRAGAQAEAAYRKLYEFRTKREKEFKSFVGDYPALEDKITGIIRALLENRRVRFSLSLFLSLSLSFSRTFFLLLARSLARSLTQHCSSSVLSRSVLFLPYARTHARTDR